MKLCEIAELLGCELIGDPEIEITGVAGLEEAGSSELTFFSNPRYMPLVRTTKAAALLTQSAIEGLDLSLLVSSNPYLDFARALDIFHPPDKQEQGIHLSAVVSPSARIGSGASIGPFVVIEDHVVIGNNVVLHPHVVIERHSNIGDHFEAHSGATVCHDSQIGNNVILHNHVTVGSDGFGFARRNDGSHHKIPQAGRVIIEDNVEVQAGTCIDRAAVGNTVIGKGTKIDNLVQVGHAAKVGANTILCAQVGIGGSTVIGSDCVLAGQVGVINHLNIGNRVIITAQSGVGNDVPDGTMLSGSPAFDNRQWLRSTVVFHRLPELARDIRQLQRKVDKPDNTK